MSEKQETPKDSRENVTRGHASPLGKFMANVLYLILKPDKVLYFVAEKWNISPNAFTILGLLISMASMVLYAFGFFFSAGVVLLMAVLCDVFDGLIAKKYNKTSAFGALLDSALDRYIEVFQLAGLIYFFNSIERPEFSFVALFYILGSVSTSYIKAKIEIYNIKCEVGFIQRLERMVMFIIFSALSWFTIDILFWGILLIAVGANYTAIQRLFYGRKVLK